MSQTPKTQAARLKVAFLAFILTLVLVLTPSSAQADEGCVLTVAGIKVCGTVLGQPLPAAVTVTVKPDPIIIAGPTSTVTVRPPAQTVTVPGPGGSTVTQTVRPAPQTITASPNAGPPSTVTNTSTVSSTETRQNPHRTDTIEPGGTVEIPSIDFNDGHLTTPEASIGFLTLLALVGLLLLAMYAGYVLGYKDKERKDTDFMRALLDSVKIRK
jgi:hypothetical protein